MKIRVGIVGCGSIAEHRHAPEYAENPNVEIVAFYDQNPDRAGRLAQKYGGKVVSHLDEMMNDKSIDAISDCSSNETHHIVSTMALKHGKHVLCEKPISITIEGAKEIIKASEASGKILMIGHNQRFSEAHKKAKEILERGELGKVLSFKTNFGHKGPEYWSATKGNSTWFFKKERSVLGVAGDLGIHKIDLIHYLLGDEIAEVSAFADALHKKDERGEPIQVCDNMVAILRMKKGTLGTASFSWTYYGEEENSTILYCERGILKLYVDPRYQIEIIKQDGEKIRYEVGQIQTNDHQTKSGVIDAFIESILHNTEPPVSGMDGLKALIAIQAALDSSEQGRHIKI